MAGPIPMSKSIALLERTVVWTFLVGSSVFLVFMLGFSLRWPVIHDSPIMFYLAFLLNHGSVPYRDFFDMNMPGTYFAFLLLGLLSGFREIPIRLADIAILVLTFALTWIWIKPFGKKAAWAACVLWGLAYLRFGPAMSLQREYLIIAPIVLAILILTRTPGAGGWLRHFSVGVLFGLAFAIRPHSVIGLPLLLLFMLLRDRHEKPLSYPRPRALVFSTIIPAAAGLLLPVAILALYLWSKGALGPFVEMARNYWPLYTHLTGEHETVEGLRRYAYLLKGYRRLGDLSFWLAAASTASFALLYDSPLASNRKQQVRLMIGLAICYSMYPVFAGQFWPYHWLLFLYFIILLSALCLADRGDAASGSKSFFLVMVLMTTLLFGGLRIPPGLTDTLGGANPYEPKGGRVRAIATYLEENLRPGDTVQPLDWTGGAVHAMLLSRAMPATRFIYDFHFYHHVSTPYIQQLRKEFIQELKTKRPRFVVEIVSEDKPWVFGADTTREFPALSSLLTTDYTTVSRGEGYIIHELIADPARVER